MMHQIKFILLDKMDKYDGNIFHNYVAFLASDRIRLYNPITTVSQNLLFVVNKWDICAVLNGDRDTNNMIMPFKRNFVTYWNLVNKIKTV